ncbi:plakophilin-3a [Odontesthes bonariensis]|uniref:plakophilin-3-like n=1 Tax=Odontesthes bonariensis TaxID=219752 RepID=UPI003F58F69C
MTAASSENVFLTALQPNNSVTTYGIPSDIQLGNGGSGLDSKARRVQQQVQMRMAQKSTLPRQNGSASQYAMSDYGGSATMKHSAYTPSFSSKSSYMYSGSRTMGPHVTQKANFSSRSAGPDTALYNRMSVGGGGSGGMYQESFHVGGHQGTMRQQNQMDHDAMSVRSFHTMPVGNNWVYDDADDSSFIAGQEAATTRQYAQSAVNGYSSQKWQGGGTTTCEMPMRRSLSGTLNRGGGMMGGGPEIIEQQQSYKGPSYRTINRITNRNRMSMGSGSANVMSSSASSFGVGGDRVDSGFIVPTMSSGSQGNLLIHRPGTLSRAMSIKSMHSVGKGMDIFNGQMGSNMSLSGFSAMDMASAVQYLRGPDPELQVLGAAYIQHQCFNESDAKDEVRALNGIGDLVKLFNSESQDVRRYATGATRNLIYENINNKMTLIKEGGIPELVKALSDNDDELRKNITGILWNLSSKENLKEKLAKETLSTLTETILVPLAAREKDDAERIKDCSSGSSESPSQEEIFCNTTGCLRNLSSGNEKTREKMRETRGLVQSLVEYMNYSLENHKEDTKGAENAMCILRNLSYQIYNELPPSVSNRLKGPTRDQSNEDGGTVGCFTPQSRKAKNKKPNFIFNEVSKIPSDMEWLWHPQIMRLYHSVLKSNDITGTTREAALGAMQNITAGDNRWASVLASWALEKEQILPTLVDNLDTERDIELRSVTGLIRNLSRHGSDVDDFATRTISHLLDKLPENGRQKQPSSEVVINICGALNSMVTGSSVAAKEIASHGGLMKLSGIRDEHDSSAGMIKAAQAASTVLANMFHYGKLHRLYKSKGFTKRNMINVSL